MNTKSRSVRLEPEVEKAFKNYDFPFGPLVNRLMKQFFNVQSPRDLKSQRLEEHIKKRMVHSGRSE